MKTQLFDLADVSFATKRATFTLPGNFAGLGAAVKALVGGAIYAMGDSMPVGEAEAVRVTKKGVEITLKVHDALTLKKVASGTLSAAQCLLNKNGQLGSLNLVDAPLEADQLVKAKAPAARDESDLTLAKISFGLAPTASTAALAQAVAAKVAQLAEAIDGDRRAMLKFRDGDDGQPGFQARLEAIKAAVESQHIERLQRFNHLVQGGRA